MKSIIPLIVACASFILPHSVFFIMSIAPTTHIKYIYDNNLNCSEFLFIKRSLLRVR